MQLLDLPDEILLIIFSCGGFEALSGGPSQCCKRLRELAQDRGLWAKALEPLFEEQFITSEKVDTIPNLRSWYIEQHSIDQAVFCGLDNIERHAREANSRQAVELVWQVLQYGLRATHCLFQERVVPRSMSHFHWAYWLLERTYQLEGIRMLVKIYSETDKGTEFVENPFDHLVALFMIKCKDPFLQVADQSFPASVSLSCRNSMFSSEAVFKKESCKQIIALVDNVDVRFKSALNERGFLVDLAKGSLFMRIVSRYFDWNTKLITVPNGSFVMVDLHRDGKELYFVDFKRDGRLRTLSEIRDQLNVAGVSGRVRYGISLNDILGYADNFQPEDCAERIYCFAMKFAESSPLAYAPHLYEHLVDRIVNHDESYHTSSNIQHQSIPVNSSQSTDSIEWLQVGKVVRFLDSVSDASPLRQADQPGDDVMTDDEITSETESIGVILETNASSALVLHRNALRRMNKSELQPCNSVPLVRIAGLLVADIGADLDVLGEYFYSYDVENMQFV